jgi:hypothetical protein
MLNPIHTSLFAARCSLLAAALSYASLANAVCINPNSAVVPDDNTGIYETDDGYHLTLVDSFYDPATDAIPGEELEFIASETQYYPPAGNPNAAQPPATTDAQKNAEKQNSGGGQIDAATCDVLPEKRLPGRTVTAHRIYTTRMIVVGRVTGTQHYGPGGGSSASWDLYEARRASVNATRMDLSCGDEQDVRQHEAQVEFLAGGSRAFAPLGSTITLTMTGGQQTFARVNMSGSYQFEPVTSCQ